jgi:Outer membrane protein beta-barrel domain
MQKVISCAQFKIKPVGRKKGHSLKRKQVGSFFNLLLTRRRIHLSPEKNSPTSEIMKKYLITALVFFATTAAFAQRRGRTTNPNTPTTTQAKDTTSALTKALQNAPPPAKPAKPGKKDWSKVKLNPKRAQDHFMFEVGYTNWAGATDSMNIQGFSRTANFYFMYNWPFKSDARLSVAAGIGIGSNNLFFHQQEVLVAAYNNQTLAFPDESQSNHYKKYKLVTTFLEVPVELRFALDPENMDHTWKFAIGTKVGLMLSAYTKGKTLQSPNGQTIGNYTLKESSKEFFNTPEFQPTLRVSKGYIGIFAQIQLNPLIKSSAGPAVLPWSTGIVISGL